MNINCLQERLIMDDLVIVKGHTLEGITSKCYELTILPYSG